MRASRDIAYAAGIVAKKLDSILFEAHIEALKEDFLRETAKEHRHRWNAGIPGVPDPNTREGAAKHLHGVLKTELQNLFPDQDLYNKIVKAASMVPGGVTMLVPPGELDGLMERIHVSMNADICGWCGVSKARGHWCDNPNCSSQKLRRK